MKTMIFFFGLLLIPGLLSCSGKGNSRTAEKNDGIITRELTILLEGNQCAEKKERQLLIRSEAQFTEVWKQTFGEIETAPAKPDVDFKKHWVVFATLGEIYHGGFEIDITSIDIKADSVISVIRHRIPGINCLTTQDIEYPFVFAQIEQYPSLKFGFRTEKVTYNCE